jgi:GxxExxY protein
MTTAKTKLLHKELTGEILGGYFTVYHSMGYGFLEGPYVNALSLELAQRGLRVEREVPVDVRFEGQTVGTHRIDLVVERQVIVEVKAAAALVDAHKRQVLSYLRATNYSVGPLLNFEPTPAFKRFVWTGKRFEA